MNISDQVKQKIIHYERMLQSPKDYDIEILNELLDDNFYEIGQSGKTWNKGQIIEYFNQQMLNTKKTCVVTMENESFLTVEKLVVLITYTFKQTDTSLNFSRSSRRSSLWKKQGESWVMVFHQGTRISLENEFYRS